MFSHLVVLFFWCLVSNSSAHSRTFGNYITVQLHMINPTSINSKSHDCFGRKNAEIVFIKCLQSYLHCICIHSFDIPTSYEFIDSKYLIFSDTVILLSYYIYALGTWDYTCFQKDIELEIYGKTEVPSVRRLRKI